MSEKSKRQEDKVWGDMPHVFGPVIFIIAYYPLLVSLSVRSGGPLKKQEDCHLSQGCDLGGHDVKTMQAHFSCIYVSFELISGIQATRVSEWVNSICKFHPSCSSDRISAIGLFISKASYLIRNDTIWLCGIDMVKLHYMACYIISN